MPLEGDPLTDSMEQMTLLRHREIKYLAKASCLWVVVTGFQLLVPCLVLWESFFLDSLYGSHHGKLACSPICDSSLLGSDVAGGCKGCTFAFY